MSQPQTARTGYFQGERLELGLRYAYRPEYVPLLLDYLGAAPHQSILEVGCGTGFLARLLAQNLTDLRIMGVDSDAEMIKIARRMEEREELKQSIMWGQGDGFHLPFADEQFDLVTSHRLL